MTSPALPPGATDDRATYLLSVTWVEFALSVILIASRFWSRTRITHSLWWDDWAILVPFVFIIIASSLFTVYTHHGGTHHVYDLQPTQISKVTELNYVSQVFCIMAIATGKISVALLIYRLQSPSKWRTWLLIFLSASSFIMAILVIAIFFAQCTPVQALWFSASGHCWDPKKTNDWDVAVSSYFAVVDFILALLPITFLWNLQMGWSKKIALCTLLGLGVFAAIAAAIKASYIPTLTAKADVTCDYFVPAVVGTELTNSLGITVKLLVWNATEMNVIIYAACLPAIRPLFLLAVDRVSSYASGKRSLFGTNSRGLNSDGAQHYKLGSIKSKPYGSGGSMPAKLGFGVDSSSSDETRILPRQASERSMDVEVQYGKDAKGRGHART